MIDPASLGVLEMKRPGASLVTALIAALALGGCAVFGARDPSPSDVLDELPAIAVAVRDLCDGAERVALASRAAGLTTAEQMDAQLAPIRERCERYEAALTLLEGVSGQDGGADAR